MRFEQAQGDIEELKERSDREEIELAYVDEAGFAQAHPNRSAWTKRGEQHRATSKVALGIVSQEERNLPFLRQ